MIDDKTLLKLHKPLQLSAVKSNRVPQSATIIWDRKNSQLVALKNNSEGDSIIEALKSVPWYRRWFTDYILITTHSPSIDSAPFIKQKNIKHVYYFDYFNVTASLKAMKRYNIPHTRLVVVKV